MQPRPLEMKVILQREKSGKFNLTIPEWIANCWTDLLVFNFDGERLMISSAERDH